MKKIVKLALILLVVMIVLISGLSFYLVQNGQKILNNNKPFLESKISVLLKTPVQLGALNLKVFPNAIVDVESLTIGKTATSPGIAIKGIKLDVAILELLKKKLLIKELTVTSPSIKIIKTKTGIQIDGLPVPEKNSEGLPASTPSESALTKTTAPQSIPGGIEIALEKFQISDATIEFQDQVSNKKFIITPLSVGAVVELAGSLAKLCELTVDTEITGITKLALESKEITFDLKEQNLSLPTLVAKLLDTEFQVNSDFNLKAFQGTTSLTGKNLDLAKVASALTAFTPALKALGVAGSVTPEIKIAINNAKEINANGTIKLADIMANLGSIAVTKLRGNLNLQANLTKQNVSSNDLNLLVGNAPMTATFNANLAGSDATVENALVKIFGGTANISGGTNLKSQTFQTTAKLTALDLGQAYQALPMPILETFAGTLNSLNLKANGSLGPKLMSSLGAQGELLLTKGTLKGTNLPAKVLAVVKDLPFIAGSLLDAVPESLRGEVTGEDTAINELKTNFTLANSSLKLNSLTLLSTIFNLTADGTIGLDKTINLNSEITFNKAFSAALASKTKELEKILDKNGQLVLPLVIRGTQKHLIIVPNLKRLIELAATKAIQDKVKEKVKDKLGETGKDLLNKFGF